MSETSLPNTERSSKLGIINMALAYLSKVLAESAPESYEDVESGKQWERDAVRLYDDAYDAALQCKPWPSAARRIALTADAQDQLDPGLVSDVTRFAVPSNFLRMIGVEAAGAEVDARDYQVLGQFVEMRGQQTTISIRYVARVPEHELLHAPLLREFIGAHLAKRLARMVTNSRTAQRDMIDIASLAEAKAWSAEAGQQGSRITRTSRTLDAMSGHDDALYRPLLGGLRP